jgi:hypothetical protein
MHERAPAPRLRGDPVAGVERASQERSGASAFGAKRAPAGFSARGVAIAAVKMQARVAEPRCCAAAAASAASRVARAAHRAKPASMSWSASFSRASG